MSSLLAWQRTAWRSVWVIVAGLVLFGAAMLAIGPALTDRLSGGGLVAAGLVIAALPAVIWLLIFRGLDRLAPEPHTHLLGAMALGALIASAVGEPVRRGVFGLNVWHEERWLWAIPIYTLSQGVLLALTIYLAVRFSVFMLDEFDERTDGIIYGAAAGLGVAVAFNVWYLLDHEGLRLDVGAARIIVASLVIASIGGLIGYALGQVRFERHSVLYLPIFMLAAAILIGVYEWMTGEAISRTLGYNPWVSVVIGAVCAVILFAVINVLVRSTVQETLAEARAAATAEPRASGLPATPYGGGEAISVTDLIVIIGGIALLVGGWALQRVHNERITMIPTAAIEVAVPERWLPLPALPPAVAEWTDNDGAGATLTLYAAPVEDTAIVAASLNPAVERSAYTELGSERVEVNGVAAIRADYAYARQQVAAATAPEIVRGREISWTAGDTQYVLALEAPESEWGRISAMFSRLAAATVAPGGAS